jgi:hypothetical protein
MLAPVVLHLLAPPRLCAGWWAWPLLADTGTFRAVHVSEYTSRMPAGPALAASSRLRRFPGRPQLENTGTSDERRIVIGELPQAGQGGGQLVGGGHTLGKDRLARRI